VKTESIVLLSAGSRSGAMKNERSPAVYLTTEELRQIAAHELEEAAALPPGSQKEELLRSAENLRTLAEIEGSLSSKLRPPTMSKQEEYRAYVIGPDGHIIGLANGFVAANDDAAIERARQFVDGHDVELWSGVRLVAILKSAE
jgi:hypothetical protein